ncbi:MAG: hypothetical protein ACRCUI_03340, partial [Polymorphobacter sp.]
SLAKVCAVALALTTAPVAAEAVSQTPSAGWQFSITPYMYLTSMSGQSQFGPIVAPINVRFGEILDHLSFAAMGNLNAQNDQWAVNVDLMYAKLGKTGEKRGLFTADVEQGIYAGLVARRVQEHAEIYAGVRYVTLDVGIKSNSGPAIERSRSVNWVDPIVGFRVNAPFNDKVAFNFMADVGGFGVGAEYDIQVWPSLQVKLGQGRWRADLGWRLNYLKYETDSGPAAFTYDMLLYGPTLGVSYTF